MSDPLPLASLSLDLDNLWAYFKTHENMAWKTYPSYLDLFIPRVLDFLKKHQLLITFFIVGKDAAQTCNGALFRAIAEQGHEVGNHSFHHEPWMEQRSKEDMLQELRDAHEAILSATGKAPIGFRGPGFCCSRSLLEAVYELGYLFDASLFPTWIGPLARLYYFSSIKQPQNSTLNWRKRLFGSVRNSLLPLKSFEWSLYSNHEEDEKSLLEIPVTTFPLMRLPIHFSYITWLSKFSQNFALTYFKMALRLCRLRGISPSLLLHPLDFLGKEDVRELDFFPGMDLPRDHKLSLMHQAMTVLTEEFTVLPMAAYAQSLKREPLQIRRI